MSLDELYAPRIARERAAMERGDTLDMVILRLRDEGLSTPAVGFIVRQIKQISFRAAKDLVALDSTLPKLDLDDLALLASVPKHCKAASWLPFWLDMAIIGRRPRARVELERRDEIKRAIAEEPAWAREIEIVRDEPDVFEIRFVRVR